MLLNAPAIDPDIDDVLCASKTPNTCPSSTLGLTLPHTNVLTTNPNTNTSNNLTSTVPSISPSDVRNIVFRNPTASQPPLVLPLTIPNAPSTVPDGPSIRPPPGIPLPTNSLTLGLTIPPPPGFPLQVNDIHYFPLWIPMARSIPNSTNFSEMAMHQAANMNFSNLQHIPLSDPTTLSVSEVQPDFKLPAPFSYQ